MVEVVGVYGQETMYMDWVGFRCDTCGAETEADASWLIRTLRSKAKISRKDMAAMTGVEPRTVKHYEWHHPSKRYFDKFQKIIRKHYASTGGE